MIFSNSAYSAVNKIVQMKELERRWVILYPEPPETKSRGRIVDFSLKSAVFTLLSKKVTPEI
jgi:hypothetical protein